MALEGSEGRVEAHDFPAQQGRETFAYLVMAGRMPVARGDLIRAVWGDAPPASADTALSSIVSKLRRQLERLGLDASATLRSVTGCYELRLPPGTWVDHDVAFDAVHQAEAALKTGDHRSAYGPSAIARQISQRPFLPGAEADWVEHRRIKLRQTLVRALECRAEIYLWNEEHDLAVEVAREAINLEPFRESAYRCLMRAHRAGGNAAEALRVYERCRALISDELGVPPSPETRQVHAEILEAL